MRILGAVVVLILLIINGTAMAHQPYCEVADLTPDAPMMIDDPTISLAFYATLESADDVDYYSFTGEKGTSVLLSMVIPHIEGQDTFAPAYALLGPELPEMIDLPAAVDSKGYDMMFSIPVLEGETTTFFEPFSRTSYWERQEDIVELPADGEYRIAVWNPNGETGRYVMVVGSKEVFGGDIGCYNQNDYWTPVGSTPEMVTDTKSNHNGGLLGALINIFSSPANDVANADHDKDNHEHND